MPPLSNLTSCTPTESNLYLASYCCQYTCPLQAPNFPSIKSHSNFQLLSSYQNISPGPGLSLYTVRNRIRLYGNKLLASRPTPKLVDHFLSVVRDCLFNIFAANLHVAGCSSTRNRGRALLWWQGRTITDIYIYIYICIYISYYWL